MNARHSPDVEFLSLLSAWIEGETGMRFPDSHSSTILSRAFERCAALGSDPAEYLGRLANDAEERCVFLSSITIGETYFFRDERQFDALRNRILPEFASSTGVLSVWSSTCASGEEAVSIAAVIEDAIQAGIGSWNYRILSTDVNRCLLTQFKTGRFPLSSFRTDGKRWHAFLEHLGSTEKEHWVAFPRLMDRFDIREFNVLSKGKPQQGAFDIVFFRNTLVYMKEERKREAMDGIVSSMKEGGILFVSSPEVPGVHHEDLRVLDAGECFYFKKETGAGHGEKRASPKGQRHSGPGKRSAPGISTTAVFEFQDKSGEFSGSTKKREGTLRAPSLKPLPSARLKDALGEAERRTNSGNGLPLTAEMGDMAYDLDDILLSAVKALNEGAFDEAENWLLALEAEIGESYIGFYLSGLVLKHRERFSEAVEAFERALDHDRNFWPALFHAGMASARTDPSKSVRFMKECLERMESAETRAPDSFLLEGFDSEYYRMMAEKIATRDGSSRSEDDQRWR
jgi:chemotaxis protein methyltransferase CheR